MFSLFLSVCIDVKFLLLAGVADSFLTQRISSQAITEHMGVMHFYPLHGYIFLKSPHCDG